MLVVAMALLNLLKNKYNCYGIDVDSEAIRVAKNIKNLKK